VKNKTIQILKRQLKRDGVYLFLLKKIRKYTIDFYRHYILHGLFEFILFSPYIHNRFFRIALFKLFISRIIFNLTIFFKKVFPNFYLFLKKKKKLKKKIKKLTHLEIKVVNEENFFSHVFDEFLDQNPRKKRTIYIDVSLYRHVDKMTGIQRVLINLIKEFKKSSQYKNFHLSYCYLPPVEPNPCLAEYDLKKQKTTRYFMPRKNDIIFFIDFDTHNINKNKDLISFLQTKKVKFAAIVYDLLPYTNPEWFPVTYYKKIYFKWFNIINKLDYVFTISKTVKKKLIRNFNLKKSDHIFPIKLGANFHKKKYLKRVFNKKKNKIENPRKVKFLMVGTLEPRKGHMNILKAFKILNAKYKVNVSLDIVGNLGWDYNNILKFLDKNEHIKSIYRHESVDDLRLEQFYSQSDVLIAGSYDEGFGLPIVEAFYNNIKVIARDIEVFREVGKDKVYYFPRNSTPHQLAAYFNKWINNDLKSSYNYRSVNFTTWKNTSDQILEKILK
jgi:glycosyltransferase involved in cell wall biosynthesis